MQIRKGDLSDPRVIDMLHYHFESARAQTAPGSAHALDLSGLKTPDIDFWALWNGEDLLAIGALKRLSAGDGEVKSMHVARSSRRTGAGSAMLKHIVSAARGLGLKRLSLETGSWDYFKPAVALYKKHGFEESGPFGPYVQDPNSVFMTLGLNS